MILNFNLIFFLIMMILGVIMSLSSNNWISIWLGIEISLMSFIPFMSNKSKLNSESCMKYFIIQSLSSSIMMMGVIMISMNMNFNMIIIGAMMMKTGMIPFHNWIISIVDGMNIISLFIMFSLLKLPPFNIISYLNVNLQGLVGLGMIISSISSINKNSLKKIMCYSSIYNMSLMVTSINEYSIWVNFMILYIISNALIMMLIYMLNVNYINQVVVNNLNYSSKLSMLIMMMAMGGLPPFIMFIGKMMILENLILKNDFMLIMVIMLTSLISMYFYIRISIISMTMYMLMLKSMYLKNMNSFLSILNLMIFTFPIFLIIKSLF